MQFYDFRHSSFNQAVHEALNNKTLVEDDLNRAVSDILRVKFLLGLFDNPYVDASRLPNVFHTEKSQDLALKAAQEGIVLLKNENSVLPLKNEKLRIAVIGELAESKYPGGYTNPDTEGISILDGLRQRAGKQQTIAFEKGYSYTNERPGMQQAAVDLVRHSDVAVVVVGENVKIVGEGKDRSDLSLDENQLDLVKAVQATGKPVAVVLFNGRPLTVNWIAEHVPAIVESWFSEKKAGLLLPMCCWGVSILPEIVGIVPRSVGQIPFYYDHKPSSKHNYVDEKHTTLFAFGHGLSYSSFEYSGLKITPESIAPDASATITVQVKNTGETAGTEVVQMYVRDEVGSVTTPVEALKGFRRVALNPGETKAVQFDVEPETLSLWNRDMKRVVEPGDFKIRIGSSSDDIRQEGKLTVVEKNE